MRDVRIFYGQLEEADRGPVRDPAHLAREKYYAQSEDAAQGSDDVVGMVITDI